MTVTSVPDFDFSGFYYPEIYQALLAYLRVHASELTSEQDEEVHIQLTRAFALASHLVNTYTDVAANELLIDSLTQRESMKRLFELINIKLASATPATCESMLIRLSSLPTTDITAYIPQYSQFGTEPDEDGEQVLFETTESWDLDKCDQVQYVYSRITEENGDNGQVSTSTATQFTDSTASAFTAGDVGKYIRIYNSQYGNAGTYMVTDYVSADVVEIATASFTTETGLHWELYDFSSDHSTEANTNGSTFTPWASHAKRNMLYVGHNNVLWDQIDITTTIQSVDLSGVWEYYDPSYSKTNPADVVNNGTDYTMEVGTLIPNNTVTEGAVIKVTYNPTGYSEVLDCFYDNINFKTKITTKGTFSQTSPDTNKLNYTIESDWIPVPSNSANLNFDSADANITWTLPRDENAHWSKATVNDIEAFWLRYRTNRDTSPSVLPTIDEIDIDENNIYFPFTIKQGSTILNEDLGSSNGQANQEFTTLDSPVFDDSQLVEVDETNSDVWVEWAGQNNLLLSGSTDRHYKVYNNDDGQQVYKFGNETFGTIPPLNAGIRSTYRVGGEEDGNVGINTITENISGIQYVGAIGNTMPVNGWSIKEAGDDEDLERMKVVGPASLSNNTKAVNTDDIERVAINEYTYNDASIVQRAVAVEEAYGLKTFKLLCVGNGGSFLTREQLDDIDEYFNGNKYSDPKIGKKLIANHELTSVNYSPREIDVTAHVVGKGITTSQVRSVLTSYLNPLATNDDGEYLHNFGGEISESLIDCAIGEISDDITDIQKTIPASNVSLGNNELPTVGTLTITVAEN